MPSKKELQRKYLTEQLSTWKLAVVYKTNQQQVLRWLERYDIPRRSYKENVMPVKKGGHHTWGNKIAKSMLGNKNSKIGKNHWNWSGDDCGYRGKHNWVGKHFGTPNYCEHCKRSDRESYQWANISGKFLRNKKDWLRLCASCHKKFDNARKKL